MSSSDTARAERGRAAGIAQPPRSDASLRGFLVGERWTSVAMVALLALGAFLCLYETRGITFSFDEWEWAIGRRGNSLSTFLSPHNGHFSLVPLVIYRILFATAGLRHYLPYRLIVTAAHLGCAWLVFVYARRRVTPLLALLAAAMLLFLGPAWQNFLWPFQTAWLISTGSGLAALLLLDRRDRTGEIGASLLLACSLASSGLGIAIAAALVVEVLGRPDRRRRAWIVAVPVALYALWWIGYQNTPTTVRALLHMPTFASKLASATMASLFGLSGGAIPFGSGTLLTYGRPLGLAGAALLVWVLLRGRRPSTRVVSLLAAPVCFWVIAGLGRAGVAQPYDSRYLYLGGLFLIVLAVELLSDVRPAAWVSIAVVVVGIAAIISNLRVFNSAGSYVRSEAQLTRADLRALDISRAIVKPSYVAREFPGLGLQLSAASYFRLEGALGTPAVNSSQIRADSEGVRNAVDIELIGSERIGLLPLANRSETAKLSGGGCTGPAPPRPGVGGQLMFTARAPGVLLEASRAVATVEVRRFGVAFQRLGTVTERSSVRLDLARDQAAAPWTIRIQSSGAVRACRLG